MITRLLPLGLFLWLNAGAATTLHVHPDGDDAANGGEATPLKTLAGAVRAARGAEAPVTILLAEGRYELEETLRLGPDDSNLTIAAAPGAKPVVSGGTVIRGWKRDPGNPRLWRVEIPSVREGDWYFHQLFVDGRRAQRARTPNEGYFRAAGRLGTNSPITLPFAAGDIRPEWAQHPDARLVLLMKWTDLHVPIRRVDTDQRVAELPGPPRPYWMDEPDARYWVENVPDALDAPGEWHLDRATGVLSWIAPEDTDPNDQTIVAPRLRTLVHVSGDREARRAVTGLTFRGIEFADTDYDMPADGLISPQAAVPVRGAWRVEFATDGVLEDCVLARHGGYALDLGHGAQRWRVLHGEIRDCGGGGIRIGEPGGRQPDAFSACGEHEIADNHIHQLGRVFAPAVGIILFHTGGNRIVHNEINDLYYTAISVGWNWGYQETPCRDNLIEFNHLHDIGQGRLSDMGGVYTLGIQPGTVVRNNLIHDVTSYRYGGWGLYTDEGSTGIVMENNVVYRCKSAGFHQHYGRDNHIRNNILAFNIDNQIMRTRDEDHTSFHFTNNIVIFESGQLLGSSWRNDRFVIDRNVYWDLRAAGDPGRMRFAGATWEEWRGRGHDVHSVIADPGFVDAANLDFRLKPDSPALKAGFRPIDLSAVGPRRRSR